MIRCTEQLHHDSADGATDVKIKAKDVQVYYGDNHAIEGCHGRDQRTTP